MLKDFKTHFKNYHNSSLKNIIFLQYVFSAAEVSLSAKFLLFFITEKQIKYLSLGHDFTNFMCSFVTKNTISLNCSYNLHNYFECILMNCRECDTLPPFIAID